MRKKPTTRLAQSCIHAIDRAMKTPHGHTQHRKENSLRDVILGGQDGLNRSSHPFVSVYGRCGNTGCSYRDSAKRGNPLCGRCVLREDFGRGLAQKRFANGHNWSRRGGARVCDRAIVPITR
jgi:hypothetical protein